MIPNHPQFIAAIQEKKKVSVRFYSKADSGVLEHICAPMNYGPGGGIKDNLNRYWFWDYSGSVGSRTLGLLPQQIVALQVLGEEFDPGGFVVERSPTLGAPPGSLPPLTVVASGSAIGQNL